MTFDDCNVLDHFAGWRILAQRDIDVSAIEEDVPFCGVVLDKLMSAAHALGITAPARAFLLWENSD